MKEAAKAIGGHAVALGKHYGHRGLVSLQDYVQQGPQGVSTLCFLGGMATSLVGGLGIFNMGNVLIDPIAYILNVYMFAFGLATTCIEADTDTIGTLMTPFDRLAEPITRAQAWLNQEVKLLTELRGRGLFYLYQGSLMVSRCVFCPIFLGGLYNVLVGILCICMSFGIKPDLPSMAGQPYYDRIPDEEGGKVAARPITTTAGAAAQLLASQEEQEFRRAVSAWQNTKDRLPGKASRELWALHQQATVGDCNEPKPTGVFNGNAKERWRLWNGRLKGVPQEDAKEEFVKKLRQHGIDF